MMNGGVIKSEVLGSPTTAKVSLVNKSFDEESGDSVSRAGRSNDWVGKCDTGNGVKTIAAIETIH